MCFVAFKLLIGCEGAVNRACKYQFICQTARKPASCGACRGLPLPQFVIHLNTQVAVGITFCEPCSPPWQRRRRRFCFLHRHVDRKLHQQRKWTEPLWDWFPIGTSGSNPYGNGSRVVVGLVGATTTQPEAARGLLDQARMETAAGDGLSYGGALSTVLCEEPGCSRYADDRCSGCWGWFCWIHLCNCSRCRRGLFCSIRRLPPNHTCMPNRQVPESTAGAIAAAVATAAAPPVPQPHLPTAATATTTRLGLLEFRVVGNTMRGQRCVAALIAAYGIEQCRNRCVASTDNPHSHPWHWCSGNHDYPFFRTTRLRSWTLARGQTSRRDPQPGEATCR